MGQRRQRFQAPSTHSVLRGWLQAIKLARTQRLLRKACKARKRERINTLLLEAENSRQPSAIFSVVRRLAPKSRTLRIQLRDKEGRLLAGVEESKQIASFLRTVFHSENTQEAPAVAPFTSVQFEATELLQALSQLGGRKALPSTFALASLWKLAPTQVTEALLPIINHAYDSTSHAWHSVQLYIPKLPMVKEPKHLRPIALLHPGNKLHAAMLATRLQPKVASPAVGLPSVPIQRRRLESSLCTHEPSSHSPCDTLDLFAESISRCSSAQDAWWHLHQPGCQEGI